MSDEIEQESAQQSAEQRVTYLDVVEQQLEASIAQAQATIASCTSALTGIRVLKSQMESARRVAEERRKASEQPARPSTFGSARRTQGA